VTAPWIFDASLYHHIKSTNAMTADSVTNRARLCCKRPIMKFAPLTIEEAKNEANASIQKGILSTSCLGRGEMTSGHLYDVLAWRFDY
jgi:hypothetical protein